MTKVFRYMVLVFVGVCLSARLLIDDPFIFSLVATHTFLGEFAFWILFGLDMELAELDENKEYNERYGQQIKP